MAKPLLVAVEWPNETNDAVLSSYADEAFIQWPDPVEFTGNEARRIATSELPKLVEYWFYRDRLSGGLPDGEPLKTRSCIPSHGFECAVSTVGKSIAEIPLPELRSSGLLIVQVEWQTSPSLSDKPLVARVSWAVEVQGRLDLVDT